MAGEPIDTAAEVEVPRPTIGELFSQLVDEATAFVRAEVALYRAQAGRKALSAGTLVALFAGAMVLAQGAVIALLVGLVLGLTPVLGIWWAIVAVVAGAIALAAILVLVGARRAALLIKGKDDQ